LEQEAVEQISGAKIVKSSAAEEVTTNRFKVRFESLARFKYISRLNQALLKVIFEVLIIGVLCIGIYSAIIYLKMTMSRLVVFLFIFYRLSPRISNLQQFRHQLLLNLPALESIEKFCEKAKKMEEKRGGISFKGLSDKISMRGVYFYYNPEEYVIEDLNIEIPKKKTIAIVGGSGAGKSTVVDLIMGLLKPVKGEILVDGKHLSEYDLKSWRRKIGYLTQDTILFHDTVKANIAWFYPEATGEEIKEAAKIAFADEFIEQFNKDYDTIVGDRGVRLSGGQKQRIALARAIIRKPEILILDEATSALDAESEKKIQKAIQVLAESITVIIVTHRLATVKNADYIYVLENSKLIEEGSWNDLVSQKGRFFELKQLQELETVEKK
ncbi:MAG: ABC transporter ATP-binding protein, partial [Actinomycetia bacterium]|nr:ABC transporter ATP-binding protein [Actinomycetes bacterium]